MSAGAASAPSPRDRDEAVRDQGTWEKANEDARWRPVLPLPCELTVELALQGVTVGDFLKLGPGALFRTQFRIGRDVPLRVNGVVIAWGELEAAGVRLAVRLTEIA